MPRRAPQRQQRGLLFIDFFYGCPGSLFSLVAASRGYPLVAVLGLLTAAASLVAERRLWDVQASVVAARVLVVAAPEF